MAHTDHTTTPDTTPVPAVTTEAAEPGAEPGRRPLDELVEDDLLVEDVSIDGMCGVY